VTGNGNHFNGKVVLITGGSSGIGLALAKKLAAQGARLWLSGRRKEALEAAGAEILNATGQTCGLLPTDVVDAAQAAHMVAEVTRQDGTPDLLINSAGITMPGYIQKLGLEVFREMMDVNYFGTVNTVKAVLPGMIERGSGHIVNFSSVAGFGGVFGYSAYGASKYAVRGFSDVLRSEMKAHGIRVSVVFPADTDTPQLAYEKPFQPAETKVMNAKAKTRTADEVAEAVLHDVQKNRYVILPGGDIKFLYHLNDLMGNAKYWLLDWWVSDARRKAGKT
jgi:3-dehydrosphinganine reductase